MFNNALCSVQNINKGAFRITNILALVKLAEKLARRQIEHLHILQRADVVLLSYGSSCVNIAYRARLDRHEGLTENIVNIQRETWTGRFNLSSDAA